MRIVLANGVFDVLHYGHIEHLREARKMGDLLIVSVTSDAFVGKGAGKPVNALHERMEILRELRCVSSVIPTDNAVSAIERIKPDIFVKGIDYAGGDRFTEAVLTACNEVGAVIRYTMSEKRTAWSK